jgi:GNAT superfamily N-acetyltransferase
MTAGPGATSQPTGLAYLAAVTKLLQSFRRVHPGAGIWEAADLQWWWRKDQHSTPERQLFWEDGAAVVTDWGDRLGLDLLGQRRAGVFAEFMARLAGLGRPVDMIIRDDDAELVAEAITLGFRSSGEVGVTTTTSAEPATQALPEGFRLLDRTETDAQAHHMIKRSGPDVEARRLLECSLYRRDCDLFIRAPDGEIAAYVLFWPDPVTGVGLVEPVRTEEAYAGRGLGKALIAEGLRRLRHAGCESVNVTYIEGNEAAKRLYLGSGFRPAFASTTFVWDPAAPNAVV